MDNTILTNTRTGSAFELVKQPLHFECKIINDEECHLARYGLAQTALRGGYLGVAENGRQLLAHLLDELRLLGVFPEAGLGLLVQCDCLTAEKLAELYAESFPCGRPLTAMVADALRNGLKIPRADSLTTWASRVSAFWQDAFVREIAQKQGIPMSRTTGTTVRSLFSGNTLAHNEFWPPYKAGIKSGCDLAKQQFDERLNVWVRPRKSRYSND
jgi:hypothetical protein